MIDQDWTKQISKKIYIYNNFLVYTRNLLEAFRNSSEIINIIFTTCIMSPRAGEQVMVTENSHKCISTDLVSLKNIDYNQYLQV